MRTRNVNISFVRKIGRFDGGYFNAEGNIYDDVVRSHSTHSLSFYCDRIYTSARGRRTYTDRAHGVPFFSNSDMVSNKPMDSCKFASRKYALEPDAILREGMILTGRVGAIGQLAIVPPQWEKERAMGSDNIIRISVSSKYRNGFLYAYLASKAGNLSFWKMATGGVQPYITDSMVGNLPIPDISDSLQEEIDKRIKDAIDFRETAANLLIQAKQRILDFIPVQYCPKSILKNAIRSKVISSSFKTRIDAPIYLSSAASYLSNCGIATTPLGSLDVTLWYPGIFKRVYVKNGLPYLQGSSLLEKNPFKTCDQLSATRTPKLEQLWLKEGQLLITCAGSLGDVKLITKEFDEKRAIGSPDIIRLTSQDSLMTVEYLYVYLQLPFSQDYIQSIKYGSVIERFDIQNIERLPVVVPSEELSKEITTLMLQYKECLYKAFKIEEEAISMVEQEVEKWK